MMHVGIAGFRGYSGAELVQILNRHPQVRPLLLEHRSDAEHRPAPINSRSAAALPCTVEAVQNEKLAAVFLATPPEVSMELAPSLLQSGAKVIDLSGAYRLGDAENYKRWYKEEHTSPELLAEAAYGLPEFCRKAIPGARLISNPGCYPTAANLAIRPLIDRGIVDRQHGIVCDAKSGVSGAGRKPSLKTHFCEVAENFSAYSILDHRHVPEVLRISGLSEPEFSFTAQLIPIDRGILETIYFRAVAGTTADHILETYQARYGSESFVRLYKPGQVPDLKAVLRTNFCDIGFRFDPTTGRVVLVSVIDNLVKGAAGQAVQNMNLALGFDETAGLF
jgi:N-acetyl-gamma-glutamyl-phosphate reductase